MLLVKDQGIQIAKIVVIKGLALTSADFGGMFVHQGWQTVSGVNGLNQCIPLEPTSSLKHERPFFGVKFAPKYVAEWNGVHWANCFYATASRISSRKSSPPFAPGPSFSTSPQLIPPLASQAHCLPRIF